MNKTLMLFDIDDTLTHVTYREQPGMERWKKAMNDIYGITIDPLNHPPYDGQVDWQIGRELATRYGVPMDTYEERFPMLREKMYYYAEKSNQNGEVLYDATDGSRELLSWLAGNPGIQLSLLTGNLEKVGWWKLKQAGLREYFTSGFFSDNVKQRVEIAMKARENVHTMYGFEFDPRKTIVVGDTVHDISCGKAIGANVMALTAGREGARELLISKGADLVIDSLRDRDVHGFIEGVIGESG